MSENLIYELENTLYNIKQKALLLFKEKELPISRDQWLVLESVSRAPRAHQKDIAKDINKDPAALTRMLDLLEKKGYVKRISSKEDRRVFGIQLTVDGSRLVARISPLIAKFNHQIAAHLSKEEQKSLSKLLISLNNAITD